MYNAVSGPTSENALNDIVFNGGRFTWVADRRSLFSQLCSVPAARQCVQWNQQQSASGLILMISLVLPSVLVSADGIKRSEEHLADSPFGHRAGFVSGAMEAE